MILPEKLEDTGNKVGMLFSIAGDIDIDTLNELIAMSDHPLAKVMMPLIAEQLKKETGLKAIPTTEMTEAMKLLAFFLVELKKVGFGKAIAEAKGGGL
jgi:uncharacterized protein with GYD domain